MNYSIKLNSVYLLISETETGKIFSGEDGWNRFYKEYRGAQGIMMLSRVGFDRNKNEALVYIGNQSDWLAGVGYYVLLRKESGKWVVKDQLMAWIS